jgi:lipoate-protein ligase A
MRYLDLTLPTLAENLALDEALLLQAEAEEGPEVLRTWEWYDFAVVLGSGCQLAVEVNETACEADDVLILRRASGGGTVLLGPGCLCYSLVLAYERAYALRGVRSSYRMILDTVANAVRDAVSGVERAGISDLALAGRKFSGNSQQRKRNFLLHQGTLLYDFDISHVGRYLSQPTCQPDYRANRDHEEFLTNLPAPASRLKSLLRSAWQADSTLSCWPGDSVQSLTTEKYASEPWKRRR